MPMRMLTFFLFLSIGSSAVGPQFIFACWSYVLDLELQPLIAKPLRLDSELRGVGGQVGKRLSGVSKRMSEQAAE